MGRHLVRCVKRSEAAIHSDHSVVTPSPILSVAVYTRVSTRDQSCLTQRTELRDYCSRMGWEPIEFIETASGKAGSKRPELERLMAAARLRKFDIVLVWKIDRFGRSLLHLIDNIRTLDQLGIRFLAPNQNIDTDNKSPMGRLVMVLMGAFAEFERDLIAERVSAGLTQYRTDYAAGRIGKDRNSRSGKNLAPHRPVRIFDRAGACQLRQRGLSFRAIAKKLGVPLTTVVQAIKGVR